MKFRNTSKAPGYVRKFQRAIVASAIAAFLGACAGGTGEETGNGVTTGAIPGIGAAVGIATDLIVAGGGLDVEVTSNTDSTGDDSVLEVSEGAQTNVELESNTDTVEIAEVDSTTDTMEIAEVDSTSLIPDNALGLIQSHPELGLFATAIQSSRLVRYLADPESQVTVFALSDNAFKSLSSIQRDALFNDPTRLDTLVRATTISDRRITESAAGVFGNLDALANNTLIFERDGGLITIAGEVCCTIPSEAVEVTDTLLNDDAAIHIIDDFINIDSTFFPPDPGSIMERLLTDEASTISDRIRYTRWFRELGNSERKWTVFVPSDDVDTYDLEPYIVAHTVNDRIISEAGIWTSVDGISHVIDNVDGELTIDDIDILEPNALQVNNGHVHRIAYPLGEYVIVDAAVSEITRPIAEEATGTEQSNTDSVIDVDTGTSVPDINLPALAFLNVRVLSNVNSINTGGTDVANITALVTDANNNALAATEVTFRSTGGVLQNISRVTDENGEASATLKLPQDFKNQDILVTVAANSYEAAVKVTALGSTLEVTGPETLVLGDQAELVLSLVAGNGEPIANQPVTVTSAAGNSIEPGAAVTDSDGRVSILVGSENSNDTIRITALNGTVNATHKFEVAADILKFAESVRGAELPVSQVNPITVTWSSEGLVVVGRALRFSTTAGEIVGDATVMTDAKGQATVNLRSSSAGPAKITVEAADNGQPKTSVDVEFIATVPGKVAIDATSTRVHTTDASTLMALVTDVNGNPVKNQVVDFTSVDLKGGQLNPASAKSNSSGVASVAFTAGDNATEVNDIRIQAKVKGTSLIDVLSLTVVKRVLNVTIGTSNEINIKPLGTQYALPFIVQVADGSGTPLEDATVKLSIRPLQYSKGSMVLVDEGGFEYAPDIENWSAHHWSVADAHIVCVTEDGNGNRILDTGEDRNGNGSLDPQDPAALAAIDSSEYATISGGTLSTDKNGSGFFEMLYPASNSVWAYVEITARAEALGAEAEDFFRTTLPLPASEVFEKSESPANQYSPYGTVLDCTNTD